MDYQKLKLNDLKLMVSHRNIDCKETKEEMIKCLIQYDNDKYVHPTTYEKIDKGYRVGISIKNTNHLSQISRLIEKSEAYSLSMYYNDRVHYWSSQKLL